MIIALQTSDDDPDPIEFEITDEQFAQLEAAARDKGLTMQALVGLIIIDGVKALTTKKHSPAGER